MMKWFDKWFSKKCQQAWDNKRTPEMPIAKSINSVNSIDSRGLNFTIYKANGGYVVEYRQYNSRDETSYNKLHIITEGQDLGNEIGKIISFESLRR